MNWTRTRQRNLFKKALGISLVGILALNTPFSSLNRVYANQPEYEDEEIYTDDGYTSDSYGDDGYTGDDYPGDGYADDLDDPTQDGESTVDNDDQDQQPTLISQWEWNDEDEILSKEDGFWYLGLPGADRSDLTEENLLELLPGSITATTSDGEIIDGIPVTWDLTDLEQEEEREFYLLNAVLPEEYQLDSDSDANLMQVFLECGDASTFDIDASEDTPYKVGNKNYPSWAGQITTIQGQLQLRQKLQDHTVSGMTPEGTTVNLFDYIADKDGAVENDILNKTEKKNVPNNVATSEEWNKGINKNRLLLFGDSMIGAGYWNLGAGAGRKWARDNTNMKGIVTSQLGSDGYPNVDVEHSKESLPYYGHTYSNPDADLPFRLDYAANGTKQDAKKAPALSDKILSNNKNSDGSQDTSLSYLFDPEQEIAVDGQQVKKTYSNVEGLFQVDEQGYYYYDARKNFAEHTVEDGSNKFILYDSPAVWRTDAGWNPATQDFDGLESLGNFFPFNKGKEVFDSTYTKGNKEYLTSSLGIKNFGYDQKDKDGKLHGLKNTASNKEFFVNHHMGMTMTVDFTQPQNGKLNMGKTGQQDMVFQFSGDDDVWIFIDDVLVLDLGGIHSELYGTINFATGEVVVGQSWRTGGFPTNLDGKQLGDTTYSLYELFKKALGEAEAGNRFTASDSTKIFPTGTTHTLKLFYLERGNYDSSLALRFNLQPPLYHSVKKVDQDGNPLAGAKFDLHAAKLIDPTKSKSADGYTATGVVKASLTTSADGKVSFTRTIETSPGETQEVPFSFSDDYSENKADYDANGGAYYILEEVITPEGYRKLPKNIVLKFVSSTAGTDPSMLVVVNRYETGAYASFFSNILETGKLTYGAFDSNSGEIKPNNGAVLDLENKKNGLVVAVPMLLEQKESVDGTTDETGKWVALYGSNTDGYKAVAPEKREAASWRTAILKAALYQASDAKWPGWYLKYNENESRLTGTLEDLPGRSDRYALTNPDTADMKMVYGIIESSALLKLGISSTEGSTGLYQELEKYLAREIEAEIGADNNLSRDQAAENVINRIIGQLDLSGGEPVERDFSFLNTDQFQRTFRSTIYIPNERRELRVQKIGEDGKGINDVTFALFNSKNEKVAAGTTANVNGQDGVLIFRPDIPVAAGEFEEDQKGYAQMIWGEPSTQYTLKEMEAPVGYIANDTPIPIVVGIYSIYADAGTKGDGVVVMAGVGKLMQTMTKYAADDRVNITLRDITAFAQIQPSDQFNLSGWQDDVLSGTDTKRSMNLHYGVNNVVNYGLHNVDGGATILPFFTTDTGFLRTRVEQNTSALSDPNNYHENDSANWDDLNGQDLTSLFSLLNTVVVTNKKTTPDPTIGNLTIRKVITGTIQNASDYNERFHFRVNLSDKDGFQLKGQFYYFYGDNKAGTITDGGDLYLKHDEAVTIRGLPVGTQWTVTEELGENPSDWKVIPFSKTATGTIEAGKTDSIKFQNYKENPPVGNLEVSKTVAGNAVAADQSKDFNFTVTLNDTKINGTFGEMKFRDGKAAFTLKPNETKKAEGLPANIGYEVSEVEADQDWYKTTADNSEGIIQAGITAEAKFTNIRNVGKLIVSKTVGGAMGDKTKEFGFTLTLTDADKIVPRGGLPYTLTTKSSSGQDETTKTEILSFDDNGNATFTLKHNQTFTITLPEGAAFEVTENDYSDDGYKTTVSAVDSNVTTDNATASGSIGTGDITVAYTNTKEGKPVTGIDDQNPAWMIAAAGGAALIAVLLLMKKYRYEKE